MMQRGYVKLWRCSVDNPMYFAEPFTKWQAWQDLLILANHKPGTVTIRGIDVHLEAGQVLACDTFLADRWKWSRNKVRRFMSRLSQKTEQQIEQQKSNVCTIATILNWKLYQSGGTANETPNDTAEGQQKDTPKNDKHYKKNTPVVPKGTKFRPPNIDELSAYVTEYATAKSKQPIDAEKFLDFYESKGWMIGKNKMKSWRAAVRTWFRDQPPPNQSSEPDLLKGYASHE